jgi:hypothetical protein
MTTNWQEWAEDLSEYRLRDLYDSINTHEKVKGSIKEPDRFLRKVLKAELEKRYGVVQSN